MPAPLSAEELAREVEAAVPVTPEVVVATPQPIAPTPVSSFDQGEALGIVNVGLVNIRSGPGSEADTEYEIVTTLKQGTELTIMGKSNDWYSIAWPQGHPCYLRATCIDGIVPSTLGPQGVSVPVKGPSADLYVRPWEKSTIVGSLQGGDIVTIIGRRGGWYRIMAPPSARAWISAKYVNLVSSSNAALSQATAPKRGIITNPNNTTTPPEEKKAKTPQIIQAYREKLPDPELLQQQAEDNRQRYFQSIDDELAAIRAETNSRKQEISMRYSGVPTTTLPGTTAQAPATLTEDDFTGWVEHIGYAVRRPAAYRLVKGGDIVFLLRSAVYNLEEYVNCRVAVNGQVELAPGFDANVLVVDKLELLDSGPLTPPSIEEASMNVEEEYTAPMMPRAEEDDTALQSPMPLGEIVEIIPAVE